MISSARGQSWWSCRNKKRDAMRQVAYEIYKVGVPPFTVPVRIHIKFIEKNARRDRDNVSSGGTKIVLDVLKHLSIIKDDSRKWVLDVKHDTTEIDKTNPRVEVEIIED